MGYSPAGWEELMNLLKKKGFREDVLLDAGLVIKKENGGIYDRFRDRLMFPIHNSLGKIVGFGARLLSNAKDQPKYINSPQTLVYDKSSILYGLFQGKNEIRKQGAAILTEGYADVISLHQEGFRNAVASSGTSLTVEQLNVLKKYCSKLYIVYDADEAGQNAAVRAIDMAIAKGFEVYIVSLPAGEDPDSIIKSRGAKIFREYLRDAELFVDFKINLLKQRNKLNTPAEIANTIRDIINTIVRIPDRLQHDEYINHLAALLKLSSRQVERIYKEKVSIEKKYGREQAKESMQAERKQTAIIEENAEKRKTGNGDFKPDYTQLLAEEKLIFKYMISHREVSEFLLNNVAIIPENMFSEEANRLLTLIIDLYGKNSDIVKYVIGNEEIIPEDRDFIIEMAIDNNILSSEWEQYAKGMKDFDFLKPVKDALRKIELYKVERELDKLQTELNSTATENVRELLTKFKDFSKKRDILIKLMTDESKV